MSQLLALAGTELAVLLLRVGLIIVAALVVIRVIRVIERRAAARIARVENDLGRRARLMTLLNATGSILVVIVLVTATLMVLYELGINITPVLASVGVAGLAISLGAQTLIKDFIGGLLILIEDTFRVGDVIQVGSTIGTVEQITLRATSVRDFPGQLWTVPNGDVRTVANQSRSWARAIVDVNVPFDTDMRQVLEELRGAMARAAENESIQPFLLEPPEVLGWQSFSDWAMQVRLVARTVAGKQVEVARVLRQEALAALGAAGIRVALPAQELRTPPATGAARSAASGPGAAGGAKGLNADNADGP